MKPLDLTPGLLVSALMRHDHSLFAPWSEADPLHRHLGPPRPRILKAMDDVIAIYHSLAHGEAADPQVSEEFLGKGFYNPNREDFYLAALDVHDLRSEANIKISALRASLQS